MRSIQRQVAPSAGTLGSILLVALVCLPAHSPARAQAAAATPSDRPRIGLVLSGGGARGAAHAGVLEVLEEMRVPIDVIVGTSMGSIVGGLYAAGHSPETLQYELDAMDWEAMFDDSIPRKNEPFRRKEEDRLPFFQTDGGIGKGGFKTGTGTLAGRKLGFALQSLSLPATGAATFDDLPTPYRAVAVDLNSGQMIVLDRGNLARAMRASMAFPGAFTPVPIGDWLLVDGGVLANMPVEVARDLGVDRIIAVDVGSPFQAGTEPDNLMAVAKRAISAMTLAQRDAERDAIGPRDLLITPDLEGIAAFKNGFEKIPEAVEKGRAAALAAAAELATFALSEADYARFRAERDRRRSEADRTFRIAAIDVEGLKRVDRRIVTHAIRVRPGDELDLDLLQEDLERVNQIGEFELVGFRVSRESDGDHLVIEVVEKGWGPNYIRAGAAIQADLDGNGEITLFSLFRRTFLNPLGAEWRTFVTVGDVASLATEWYQPLTFSGRWFVAPALIAQRNEEPLFLDKQNAVLVDADVARARVDLGFQYGNHIELRVGADVGRVDADFVLAGVPQINESLGGWVGRLAVDTLDDASFPEHGTVMEVTGYRSSASLGSDLDYDVLQAEVGKALTFGKQSLIGTLAYGSGLDTELPFYELFQLGGFLSLSGFDREGLIGDRLGLARLVFYRNAPKRYSLFAGDVHIGASIEYGHAWFDDTGSFEDAQFAGSLFVGMESWFGPLYFAYGYGEGGNSSFYLFLGRVF